MIAVKWAKNIDIVEVLVDGQDVNDANHVTPVCRNPFSHFLHGVMTGYIMRFCGRLGLAERALVTVDTLGFI